MIRERLTQPPFSAAFLFQEFAQRNETYKEVCEPGTPSENQDDIAESMIDSMMQCVDDELHEFIAESGQQLITILQNYLRYLQNE